MPEWVNEAWFAHSGTFLKAHFDRAKILQARVPPHGGCYLQDNGSWSKLFFWVEYVATHIGHTHTTMLDLTSWPNGWRSRFVLYFLPFACQPTVEIVQHSVFNYCQDSDKVKNWVRWSSRPNLHFCVMLFGMAIRLWGFVTLLTESRRRQNVLRIVPIFTVDTNHYLALEIIILGRLAQCSFWTLCVKIWGKSANV